MTALNITTQDVLDMTAATELGKAGRNKGLSPHQLQHAGTANSGFSIGVTQIDLAEQREPREQIAQFALDRGVISTKDPNAKGRLEAQLAQRGNPAFLNTETGRNLNVQLDTPKGHAKAAKLDHDQADRVLDKVQSVLSAAKSNPRYKTDPAFKASLETKACQLSIADNINQYGQPNDLANFLSGRATEKVKDATGKPITMRDDQLCTPETFIEYESNFGFVKDPKKGGAISQRTRAQRRIDHFAGKDLITEDEQKDLHKQANAQLRAANDQVMPGEVVVNKGDSLWGIAREHGVSVDALQKANPGLKDASIIHPGQKLNLPEDAVQKARTPAPLPPRKPTPPSRQLNLLAVDPFAIGPGADDAVQVPEGYMLNRSWLDAQPDIPFGAPKARNVQEIGDYIVNMDWFDTPAANDAAYLEGLSTIHADPQAAKNALRATLPERASMPGFGAAWGDALGGLRAALDGKNWVLGSGATSLHPDAPQIAGLVMDKNLVDQAMRAPAYSNKSNPLHGFTTGAVKSYFGATYADNAPNAATRNGPLEEPGRKAKVDDIQERLNAAYADEERANPQRTPSAAPRQQNAQARPAQSTRTQRTATQAAAQEDVGAVSGALPTRTVRTHKLDTLGENAVSAARAQTEQATQLASSAMATPQDAWSGKTLADKKDAIRADVQRRRNARERDRAARAGALGNESLYGAVSMSGALGTAGYTDAQGDYHSGTTSRGNRTGGVKVDKFGREIGAYGQHTRDIVGRGDGSASAGNTRVICTELVRQGLMDASLQRLDVAFTLKRLSPATVRGYHVWAVPYVRWMRKSRLATALMRPVATWRALEIAYQLGERAKPHLRGKLVRSIMEPACRLIGHAAALLPGDPDRFYPYLRAMR